MFSTLWHGMSFLEAVVFWVEIQLMRSDCVLDPTSFRNFLVSRYSSGQKKNALINMDDWGCLHVSSWKLIIEKLTLKMPYN